MKTCETEWLVTLKIMLEALEKALASGARTALLITLPPAPPHPADSPLGPPPGAAPAPDDAPPP